MRHQIDLADPGCAVSFHAAQRNAIQMRIGQRHGLDEQIDIMLMFKPRRTGHHRADQGAFEGQNAPTLAARAFGKQHQSIMAFQPLDHGVNRSTGFAAPLALDENRALPFRQPGKHRPGGDVGLGDEGQRCSPRQDDDIQP